MKTSQRYLPIAIILGMVILACIIFEPFVMNEILVPIGAAIWLLLRIFVLSVDQVYYWVGLIVLGFVFVVFRFIHHLINHPAPLRMQSSPDPSLALMNAEAWRNRIELAAGGSAEQAILKRELAWLLVSMYTHRRAGSAYLEVYEPLRQRKIPLPDRVWSFIFEKEPPERKPGLVRSIRAAFQTRLQKWSGRETAEYYQAVAEVLTFLETSLEMNDDNQ
jgi:hypothetical protein